MNPEKKTAWLEALRSGDYAQGRNRLAVRPWSADGNTAPKYCCLGVLCDLAVKDGVGEWEDLRGAFEYRGPDGKGAEYYLPLSVVRWAGLPEDDNPNTSERDSSNPKCTDDDGESTHLGSLNDNGLSFEEIANIIEEQF
jgi:hypothetical protein